MEVVAVPRREGPRARGLGVLEKERRWVGREVLWVYRHAVAEGIIGCKCRCREV